MYSALKLLSQALYKLFILLLLLYKRRHSVVVDQVYSLNGEAVMPYTRFGESFSVCHLDFPCAFYVYKV